MPAGKAKIRTIDRNKIKSKGNLPIPHSEKAKASVGNGIFFFIFTQIIYLRIFNFTYWLSKNY